MFDLLVTGFIRLWRLASTFCVVFQAAEALHSITMSAERMRRVEEAVQRLSVQLTADCNDDDQLILSRIEQTDET